MRQARVRHLDRDAVDPAHLLGDPQQLPQVTQADHPGDSAASVLEHLLDGEQTIPPGRVQAMRISEPLLWRPFGWVRVEVDVAGYSASDQQMTTGALLPVAPRQLAVDLVARVLGCPLPVADRPVPRAARWRAPLQVRRLLVGVDARHVVSTSGVFTTTTDIAPLAKVQSLRTTAGPWQRRLGLTSLHVDTAGRTLPGAVLPHRSDADARALMVELVERARAAR